ncbi:hypothetical protein F53441_14724, partial [Fusarium austroafricanum]
LLEEPIDIASYSESDGEAEYYGPVGHFGPIKHDLSDDELATSTKSHAESDDSDSSEQSADGETAHAYRTTYRLSRRKAGRYRHKRVTGENLATAPDVDSSYGFKRLCGKNKQWGFEEAEQALKAEFWKLCPGNDKKQFDANSCDIRIDHTGHKRFLALHAALKNHFEIKKNDQLEGHIRRLRNVAKEAALAYLNKGYAIVGTKRKHWLEILPDLNEIAVIRFANPNGHSNAALEGYLKVMNVDHRLKLMDGMEAAAPGADTSATSTQDLTSQAAEQAAEKVKVAMMQEVANLLSNHRDEHNRSLNELHERMDRIIEGQTGHGKSGMISRRNAGGRWLGREQRDATTSPVNLTGQRASTTSTRSSPAQPAPGQKVATPSSVKSTGQRASTPTSTLSPSKEKSSTPARTQMTDKFGMKRRSTTNSEAASPAKKPKQSNENNASPLKHQL